MMMTLEANCNPNLHDGETPFFIFMCALRPATLVDAFQASFEQTEETAVRLYSFQITASPFQTNPVQDLAFQCGGKLSIVG